MSYLKMTKFIAINAQQYILKRYCTRLQIKEFSSQPASSLTDAPNDYKNRTMSIKVRKLKPQKQPFAKNLFLGKFDTDILTYPEVLNKEQLADIEQQANSISSIIEQDSKDIENSDELVRSILYKLKDLGFLGQSISQQYKGIELNVTERCRLTEELWKNVTLGSAITSQFGEGGIGLQQFGTEDQKKRYLPLLASGEWVSSFCVTEKESSEDGSLKTTATLSEDETYWVLNGEKVFVKNGINANLLIVLAKTLKKDHVGDYQEGVTTFIVESNTQGIEQTQSINKKNYSDVIFSGVKVPAENVLGELNCGIDIAMKILEASKLSTGAAGISIMRDLMSKITKLIIKTHHFGKLLSDSELIQHKLAKIASSAYAIESMTYLTASLLDEYEKPDCIVETAMIKVFSSEECLKAYTECIQILGAHKYLESPVWSAGIQEVIESQLIEETNDSLNLLIALAGLQHTGITLNETVKKLRNPLMYPGFVLKKAFDQRSQTADKPNLTLHLNNFLHPTLQPASQWLEYSVLRLQYATEIILTRNGNDVVLKQVELQRLSKIATIIYAMTCAISRASRSYCIGLQHSDYEMYLASVFSLDGMYKVKSLVKEIEDGPYVRTDNNYFKISKQIFRSSGLFTTHALTKNF